MLWLHLDTVAESAAGVWLLRKESRRSQLTSPKERENCRTSGFAAQVDLKLSQVGEIVT